MRSRCRPFSVFASLQAPALELEGSASQPGAMSPARKSSASDIVNEIATVRIELRHTNPIIWRQVELQLDHTQGLHDIVQIVMGWFDYHLWKFTIG